MINSASSLLFALIKKDHQHLRNLIVDMIPITFSVLYIKQANDTITIHRHVHIFVRLDCLYLIPTNKEYEIIPLNTITMLSGNSTIPDGATMGIITVMNSSHFFYAYHVITSKEISKTIQLLESFDNALWSLIQLLQSAILYHWKLSNPSLYQMKPSHQSVHVSNMISKSVQLTSILGQNVPLYVFTAIVIVKQKKSFLFSVKVMQRKNAFCGPLHDYCSNYALKGVDYDSMDPFPSHRGIMYKEISLSNDVKICINYIIITSKPHFQGRLFSLILYNIFMRQSIDITHLNQRSHKSNIGHLAVQLY